MGVFGDLVGTGEQESGIGSARADVVTADGTDAASLPRSVDDVAEAVPVWLSTWCNAHDVPDMRKASPMLFRAFCMDVGRMYVKPSRIIWADVQRRGGKGGHGVSGAYDPAKVLALWEVFLRVCAECDKTPFQTAFASFCGVSVAYVREYVQELTSAGFNLAQKTHDAEMDALRQQSSRDPVGRLAILNNEYWGNQAGQGTADTGHAQALPSVESFGLIENTRIE